MTKPDIDDDHDDLLRRACAYMRSPSTSEDDALSMLRMLCTMARKDGSTETWKQVLRDLELIKAPATARPQ